ncbi:hypothetical protein EV44_g3279 [Erysiphe necator]|uniref:Chromo domain-containing protein n=1 Tax=Uncinula necator TaxID=52586 RepID=A0A0B1NWW8_UNCNE|nr:hypothetical protein EV44_g3279 [Erysiphe necator]
MITVSSYTPKECWDNLKEFYCPNSTEDVHDLLEEFWGLTVEDDIDIDEFIQKLAEIRGKISLVDRSSTPQDKSMKKRLLGHFIKCCGGSYMSTVISLKDPSIFFQAAVTSIRSSKEAYRELHPPSPVALTVDGSKWAAKNPNKAVKTMALQKRLSNRKNKKKKKDLPHKKEQKAKTKSEEKQHEVWSMEEFALSSVNLKNNDFVFDIGATNYIFHVRNLFCSLITTSKSVTTASGDSISLSGIGRVRFEISDYPTGKLSKWIEIEKVLYIPSCRRNLVSGNQLLSKGLEIQSSNRSFVVLSSDGKVIATAGPKSGLFYFNTKHFSYIASNFLKNLLSHYPKVIRLLCILSQAGLPPRFWDAAVTVASYLRNRFPVCPKNHIPYELMNGVKDPQRYKLLPASQKGIFVGYYESTTQYRVYIPTKPGPNKFITSNVHFFENSLSDWNKSSFEKFDHLDYLVLYPETEYSDSDDSSSIVENETHDVDSSSSIGPSSDSIETSEVAENFSGLSNQKVDTDPSLRRSNRIRKYIELQLEIHADMQPPQLINSDGEEEQVVEKILSAENKRRGRCFRREVLVKWKKFEEPNWEARDKLEETEALDIFEPKYEKGDGVGEDAGARRGPPYIYPFQLK